MIPHGEYGGLASQRRRRRPRASARGARPAGRRGGHADVRAAAPGQGARRPRRGARARPVHPPARRRPGPRRALGRARPSWPRSAIAPIVREGFLDMDEVAELFAAADTVALPYREASQSGVLLLAYGFSRPVIVYPSGGMLEAVVDGETGWVCSEPDAGSSRRGADRSVRRRSGRGAAPRRAGARACRRALRLAGDRAAHGRGLRGRDLRGPAGAGRRLGGRAVSTRVMRHPAPWSRAR